MTAPRYAVETVRGNIAVLSENALFGNALVSQADSSNLEATFYSPSDLIQQLKTNHSLPTHDLWLIDLTLELGAYILGEGRLLWSTLTTYPHPHLYLIEKAWEKLPLELPDQATKLIVGEYLGAGGEGTPTLTRLKNMLQAGKVILGDGGLSQLHLMSEAQYLESLVAVCEHAPKSPQITIAGASGTSLLTLVQHLQSGSHQSFTLSFDDQGLVAATESSFHRTTHALFEKISSSDPLELALNYLQAQKIEEKVPEHVILKATPPPVEIKSIPDPLPTRTTRLPKLTLPEISSAEGSERSRPRNLSNFEFVPLSKPRPKRRLPLLTLLKRKGVKLALKGVALGLIVYFGSLALALGITLVTVNNLKSQLSAKNLSSLRPEPIAKAMGSYLYGNAIALGQKDAAHLLDLYQQVLVLSGTAATLSEHTKSIATYVLADGGDNLAPVLTNTRLEIENLYSQLSLLDGSLKSDTPKLISNYDESYQALKKILPELKKQTLLAKGVASILPEVIAVGGRAKYLVLFQNNMELRPTGGFIGSYGLISFENGKLYDFQVYDVYSADGQLKGHVEPPEPIKKILGEAKWYLRDSNFDPDFPTTARRAEWFLKKSMNQDVQGTIGINLETLRGMLQAVGPLELPDYNETVNANNLAERAQFHAEVNFFPGSTAKKEFLSSVGDALFQKLKEADAGILVSLSTTLAQTLESSDTQLSSLNDGTERVLQTLGWNGGLENKPCPGNPCYDDYYYQVDSNFGVNKANFYITKDAQIQIMVNKEGIPENTVTTTWKNSATSNAWPAGSYKNYTRTYLPSGASVTSLKIGDTILASADYTVTSEHGRTVVGYLVTVPIDYQTTSTLTYTLSTPLKTGTLYSLYLQRQSGVRAEDKIKISLELPLYLKANRLSPEPSELTPQKLVFSFANDVDHRVAIQF